MIFFNEISNFDKMINNTEFENFTAYYKVSFYMS